MLSDFNLSDARIGELAAFREHLLLLERKILDLELDVYGADATYDVNGRNITSGGTNPSDPSLVTKTYDSNRNLSTVVWKGVRSTYHWEKVTQASSFDGTPSTFWRLASVTDSPV